MGGTDAKALTFGSKYTYVAPSGRDPTIIAHELTHVETHVRLGAAYFEGAMPAWFDEGLAVIVSQDARYIKITDAGGRSCVKPSSLDLPLTPSEWLQEVSKDDRPIYAMSACRVSGWLTKYGNEQAVETLILALQKGAPFYE